jgi:hypothetical protein
MDAAPGIHAGKLGTSFEPGQYIVLYNNLVADNVAGITFDPDHPAHIVCGKQNVDGNAVMRNDDTFFFLYWCVLFFQDSPSPHIAREIFNYVYLLVASFRPMNSKIEPVQVSKTRLTMGRFSHFPALSTMAARTH